MNSLRILALTTFSLFLVAPSVLGQTNLSNARAFGLGGAYLTQASGVEAVRWNPASLGLPQAPKYSLMFASLGLGVSNNAFNQADYNLYNGAKLSATDKQNIMQRLPVGGWNFRAGSEIDLAGFSLRNLAALISFEAFSDANLPRDLVDLVLNGNALHRRYDFAEAEGAGLALATVGMAYGHAIKLPQKSLKLALGGTIKYLRGLSFVEITESRGHLLTTTAGVFGDAAAHARQASGGNGFGLDLGATVVLKRQWQFGLTLRNVVALIHWNRNVRRYEYGVHADSLTLVAVEDDENAVFGNASHKSTGQSFLIALPPVLHVGASRSWRQYLVSADVLQGLRSAYGVSHTPELRVGVELNVVPVLALRVGLRGGGHHKLGSAIGVGVRAGDFNFDLAAGALGGVLPLFGKGMGLAMSMRVVR